MMSSFKLLERQVRSSRFRLSLLVLVYGLLVTLSIASPAHALQASLPDFTTLVKKNYESVVNVSISQWSEDVEAPAPNPELFNDRELDELLRRFQDEQTPRGPSDGAALGSGFIISADGYILTNNHVVQGADEVLVRLHDRRQLIAEVVGTDPRSDMAVLKVDATNLPVVSIGNSDVLEVGEWVLAIGSPFGFDFSVTAGIVSATGRALPNENYVPFIQTDVAINPGNSGGPLFNLDGDVIGINSQIYSRTGSFMGLSFAIPIELAMNVADQIRANGRVTRGWLGVIIQEVTMELAESFSMDRAYGALVSSVLPNSPASRSTLAVGDIITHFNGKAIERSSSLPPLVGRVLANSDATLQVVRKGEPVELTVNIAELPSDEELGLNRGGVTEPESALKRNALKLTVKPLDEDVRESLGIDTGAVLVESVEANGPAQRAGIHEGDVISTIDNRPVDSAADVDQVLAELGGRKSVAVLIHRAGGPVFLALQLDQ